MSVDIWIADYTGAMVCFLDSIISARWSRIVSKVGWFEIVLPASFNLTQVKVDYIVEIWRRPTEDVSYREFVGFVRKFTTSTDRDGSTRYIIAGPCSNELVRRRIVAYASGSAYSTKTDYSDDLLKALIYENLLDGGVDTDRIMTGVTKEDDLSLGYSLTYACAWDDLEGAMDELIKASSGYGTPVYWQIEYQGSGAFYFYTKTGQLGLDRTSGDVITFGLEFGNLSTPTLTLDYSSEVTYVYVGGPGDGSSRTIVEVEDAARSSRSPFGRREAFLDARNETTTAAQTAKGNARLDGGKPKLQFRGRLLDTPQARYGADWGFGDQVMVTYDGRQLSAFVTAVTGAVGADGLENIEAYCEVDDVIAG